MNRLPVLLAVCVLVLAACSGQAPTPTTVAGSAGPVGVEPAADPEYPVTVSTAYGKVTIKKQPQRVVALGYGDADTALALGVSPVGISDWQLFGGNGVGPWAADLVRTEPEAVFDPQPMSDPEDPQYDRVELLEPDLILQTDLNGDTERYKRLAAIAPVIAAPAGLGEWVQPAYDHQTLYLAEALGVPQQGEKLLNALDAKVRKVAEAHPEFQGRTISTAQYTSQGWWAELETTERFQFFQQLGFRQAPRIEKLAAEAVRADPDLEGAGVVTVPDNAFGDLDADLVVLDASWDIGTDWIARSEDYTALPAARDGRSIILPWNAKKPFSKALNAPSILSADWLLDTFPPVLAKALS